MVIPPRGPGIANRLSLLEAAREGTYCCGLVQPTPVRANLSLIDHVRAEAPPQKTNKNKNKKTKKAPAGGLLVEHAISNLPLEDPLRVTVVLWWPQDHRRTC
jgi:hypothetical protein